MNNGTMGYIDDGSFEVIPEYAPPPLACENGQVSYFHPDGSQFCADPGYLGGPGTLVHGQLCPEIPGTASLAASYWNAITGQCELLPPGTGTVEPGPPLMVCPDGTISHTCSGGTSTTPVITGNPTLPAPGTNPTTPGGILDGIVDANGLIFGYSPWLVGAVAVGAFFMFGSGKK